MLRMLQFSVLVEKEGDGYVAVCPEIDVSGRGRTEDEAK